MITEKSDLRDDARRVGTTYSRVRLSRNERRAATRAAAAERVLRAARCTARGRVSVHVTHATHTHTMAANGFCTQWYYLNTY